ncbi:MAG: hypothetical protein AAF546_07295 [Verrucomicrobiota bacterium]
MTSAIQSGIRKLDTHFEVLCAGLRDHLDVSVLNIIYEAADQSVDDFRPKLILVIESEEDFFTLFSDELTIVKRHARFIKNTLESITRQTGSESRFPCDELLITGFCMSMIAIDYVCCSAHLRHRAQMIQRLSEYGIQDILNDGDETIMVFDTEKAKKIANSKSMFHTKRIYHDYLFSYDHLNLLLPSDVRIRYDSWENLSSLSLCDSESLDEATAV